VIRINLIVSETRRERLLRQNLENVRRYQARYPDRVKASKNPLKVREAGRRFDLKHRRNRYSAARRYGMTADQVDNLVADQDGKCKLCGDVLKGGRKQAIDHNHDNGIVRGVLCCNCNTALGKLKDDPDLIARASEYVRKNGLI
jgi:hypothetical protein